MLTTIWKSIFITISYKNVKRNFHKSISYLEFIASRVSATSIEFNED
jgi:hypothetical protein